MRARRPLHGITAQYAADALKRRGAATGRRMIFSQMRRLGILAGRRPTPEAIKCGLAIESEGSFVHGSETESYQRVYLTRRGLDLLDKNLWRPHCDVELGVGECKLGL